MEKGRPKKSDLQKSINGTLRKHRQTQVLNFDSLTEVPDPLEGLLEDAQRYYNFICGVLISNGSLTIADIPAITQAAKLYGIFSLASAKVDEGGWEQTAKTGFRAKSADYVVMTDAYKNIKYFENLYGFNLSARGKINIPQKKEINPLDEI